MARRCRPSKGGFHLAQQAGFRIVPVGIAGTYSVLPRDTFPVYPGQIAVAVGAPMTPPALASRRGLREAGRKRVDRLRHEARKLWTQPKTNVCLAGRQVGRSRSEQGVPRKRFDKGPQKLCNPANRFRAKE